MKGILCFSIVLLSLAAFAQAADTIKIGPMGLMTGAWGNSGKEMKLVVELLAQDINSRGGILGKKSEIVQ